MAREDAGIWVRVSTADQTEANQVPDVLRYCKAHEYNVARKYELNDTSASKGEQQEALDQVLDDMRHGVITVLVCWWSDRLERRGVEALFKLLRETRDAGGRIESVNEPMLGMGDISGETVTAFGAIQARAESAKISARTKVGQAAIKANNATANRAPWGYITEGPKQNRKLIPTELCRDIVPQIFQWCIDGDSRATIARRLDALEVPTANGGRWNEGTIGHLLRNRTYAGRRVRRTARNGKPGTYQTCDGVITPETFDRAQKALQRRPKRGPVSKNLSMLAKLRCARCGSPMYRHPYADGRVVYRCAGQGPQRKGCGNAVPFDFTNVIIATRIFITSTDPHRTKRWAEGTNYDSEISDLLQDIRELNPLDDDYMDQLTAKKSELDHFKDLNAHATKGEWVYDDTGQTVGDYFDSLDDAGKREYLKTRDIRVEKVSDPEPGASKGIRVVIDGEDHGVFPYPSK